MEKIKIITDSTCDLPKEIIEKYDIEVVHLSININGKSYKDGIDIDLYQLSDIIAETGDFPVTSQVNPDVFNDVYEKYLNKGYKILSIHISDKLSNTCRYASISKDILESNDIHIFDSLCVSMGLGLIVYEAAEMVSKGYSLNEIIKYIESLSMKVNSRFLINDLSTLSRSGRIDNKMVSFASILGIKPVVGLVKGELSVIDRVIGVKKSINYLIDFIKSGATEDTLIWVIYHGESQLFSEVKKFLDENNYKYIIATVGCVVGVYAGNECVGIFYK